MILILGSNKHATAIYYKKLNLSKSLLVTSEFEDYNVGHTSPQDAITYNTLTKIALRADQIYFAFSNPSEFDNMTFYYEYLDWLNEFQFRYRKISNWKNFELDGYKWNLTLPVLSSNDAVFIGCSFTEGIGIELPENKYANIVSKHFNLNCVNLGKGGASNSYFCEIFSQLNFNRGQLVVLQLTGLERLRYCSEDEKLRDVQFSYLHHSDYKFLDIYNNKFLFYETLKLLRLINIISQEKNLKLAIWLNNYKGEHAGHYTKEQQRYFFNWKSYVPSYLIQDYCVDVGSDNLHPGIESNKNIANALIYFINQTYNEI